MAALHFALETLSPTAFSAVPTDEAKARAFVQNAFSKAQLILDSVPPPVAAENQVPAPPRSRSNTTSSASSEMSTSSARSEPLDPAHMPLRKEWGKPIRLSVKENPMGMAVYKMAGKDGRGAWFARRSVHEGMGFRKWKMGLQKEFPESMEVQGGPGEGNIRGIGGERRVERRLVKGLGMVEVYHLSAQFPGPTAPRDFVTLLITSSSALDDFESQARNPRATRFTRSPRHFMVISKPCIHPDCPPRDGYIRGQYESVEFIREIPTQPRKAASTTELLKSRRARANSSSLDRAARLRSVREAIEPNGDAVPQMNGISAPEHSARLSLDELSSTRGRQRGKTISFAESRGSNAKGEVVDTGPDGSDELAESNPVEWIMVTRSDPGGNVPRFLVERGTPSSIVADASKFLDWAIKKEHPITDDDVEDTAIGEKEPSRPTTWKEHDLEAPQTNGHLAGLDGPADPAEPVEPASLTIGPIASSEKFDPKPEAGNSENSQTGGLLASVANAAYISLETYAPQIIIDRLPRLHQTPSTPPSVTTRSETPVTNGVRPSLESDNDSSVSSASSTLSFASAEEDFSHSNSRRSTSQINSSDSKDIEVTTLDNGKLNEKKKLFDEKKKALDEKLAKSREKETKGKEELTAREEERIRKAEEKHAREVRKQEDKYKKDIVRLEAKRAKEAAKEEEKRRKAEDKDERTRLQREKDELKQQFEAATKEIALLQGQVGALQKENTALVVRIGKLSGDAPDLLLRDVKTELAVGGGSRSRSASLRRLKPSGSMPIAEASALAPEKRG